MVARPTRKPPRATPTHTLQPEPAGYERGASVVRDATRRDLRYLTHLAKKFCDAVGFLPAEAVESYIEQRAVKLAIENGEPAGFILWKPELSTCPPIRPILQAAVQMDAQRRRHGLHLVATVLQHAIDDGRKVVQLKCRHELEANEFWQAAGFSHVADQLAGGRRKGHVRVWAQLLQPLSAADLILKEVERNRGPGGFFSSRPLKLFLPGQIPEEPADAA